MITIRPERPGDIETLFKIYLAAFGRLQEPVLVSSLQENQGPGLIGWGRHCFPGRWRELASWPDIGPKFMSSKLDQGRLYESIVHLHQ
jgi:hypothetical protein